MSTPKDMRGWNRTLANGDQVHVYSDARRMLLQVRRSVPTVEDVLAPSFKVAVELGVDDALTLAAELLTAAVRIRNQEAALPLAPPLAPPDGTQPFACSEAHASRVVPHREEDNG